MSKQQLIEEILDIVNSENSGLSAEQRLYEIEKLLVKETRVSVYKATEQGWQYCNSCEKDTWHTPKLGLVFNNKRLCSECGTSNELNKDEQKK